MCARKCSVRCDGPTDVPWDNGRETLMPIGETCCVCGCVCQGMENEACTV